MTALSTLLVILAVFQTGATNVWNGVYSDPQAARGLKIYNIECRSCHKDNLSGVNGHLIGDRFMNEWREDNIENLLRQIRKEMPPTAPGRLPDHDYVDVIAYILKMNGFPSGARELQAGNLKRIQIQGKDGPQPLPDRAQVQVVGCLNEKSAGAWMTTKSTLERTWSSRRELPNDAIQSLAKTAPGIQTFAIELSDFLRLRERLKQRFDLKVFRDRRVVVRGSIQRTGVSLRIFPSVIQLIPSSPCS